MAAVRVSNRHLIEWMERNGWTRRKASGILWTYRYDDHGRAIDVKVAAPHANTKTDAETLRDILRVSGVNRSVSLAASGLVSGEAAVEQAIAEVGKVGLDYFLESGQEDQEAVLTAAEAVEAVVVESAPQGDSVLQLQAGPVPYRSRRVSRALRNALHAARLLFADGVLTFTAGQLLAVHPDPGSTTEPALRALFNHNPEFVTVGRGRYQLNQKVARTITEPLRTPRLDAPLPIAISEMWEMTQELVRERSAEGQCTDPSHVAELLDLPDRKQARDLLYRMSQQGLIERRGRARYALPGTALAEEVPQEALEAAPEPLVAPEPQLPPSSPEPRSQEPAGPPQEGVQPMNHSPKPSQMSASPYELVDELLDLMLPNGFKAKHFTKVANWREATLALIEEVGE